MHLTQQSTHACFINPNLSDPPHAGHGMVLMNSLSLTCLSGTLTGRCVGSTGRRATAATAVVPTVAHITAPEKAVDAAPQFTTCHNHWRAAAAAAARRACTHGGTSDRQRTTAQQRGGLMARRCLCSRQHRCFLPSATPASHKASSRHTHVGGGNVHNTRGDSPP